MAEVLSPTGAMAPPDTAMPKPLPLPSQLRYVQYSHDLEAEFLPSIRALISKDLSEPYSIYVYRYFLCQWAHLCFMVCDAPNPCLSDFHSQYPGACFPGHVAEPTR